MSTPLHRLDKSLGSTSLILGNLNRPEYVALPETYISCLAWNELELVSGQAQKPPRKAALVYKKRRGSSTKLKIYETDPRESSIAKWVSALGESNVEVDQDDSDLGRALAKAIAGVYVTEATSLAAVPLSPNIALLQDRFGMMSKQNPADVGLIIEQLFQLGNQSSGNSHAANASKLWLEANEIRMSSDPLLKSLNKAALGLLPFPVVSRNFHLGNYVTCDFNGWNQTPFHWFAETWTKLTSEAWVTALPTRVWVDWATTILRLAYGLGYLYESAWFDNLARGILAKDDFDFDSLLHESVEILPWASRRAPQSIRNVAPKLNRPVLRSQLARREIVKWLLIEGREANSVDQSLELMKNDRELRRDLESVMRSKSTSTKNVVEAVRYSLVTRETSGGNADLFGLLQRKGSSKRVLYVDPAPDWIAVIASMCCAAPGTSIALGKIQGTLRQMGLKPTRDDLVHLLEKAGMTRGSADSDQGLMVQSAY